MLVTCVILFLNYQEGLLCTYYIADSELLEDPVHVQHDGSTVHLSTTNPVTIPQSRLCSSMNLRFQLQQLIYIYGLSDAT